MPSAHVNGIDIHFERFGQEGGRRTIFFNGTAGTVDSARLWLPRIADGLDLLVHDQRCLGRTTVTAEVPTMADYAADAAALLDHLGWDGVAVVGISFGGMVAQEFAVTYPERVERLALLCTSPGGEGGSSYPLHEVATLPPDEQEALQLRLMDRRFTPEYLADRAEVRAFVEAMAAGRRQPKSDLQLRGEALQLQARSRHDVWDRLPRITCPTLVMAGEHDMLAPPENSERIVSRVAGAELRRYDGGHLFAFQDRDALPDLHRFLTAAPSGAD